MATKKKALQAAAGAAGGGFTAIEDVFSTYLYTGNGSTQTITNDIDLAGEGGLVWIKDRTNFSHNLADTERGSNQYLFSDGTQAQFDAGTARVSSFNSDGFSLGSGSNGTNRDTNAHASWTFRKAPRFFDVVTWTGDGTDYRQISHNLGTSVGFLTTKAVSSVSGWLSYHRSTGNSSFLRLDVTDAVNTTLGTYPWDVTDTTFQVSSTYIGTNTSGVQYVAYLFAHNDSGDGEFGPDADQDIIKCGSYTGNGSTNGPEIDLGFEPQWVLIKNASLSTENWVIFDTMRGLVVGTGDKYLRPNLSVAESAATTAISPQPNGFKLAGASGEWNGNGNTMIYIAIRRGPMRVPKSGTEVFAIDTFENGPPAYTSGFPVDWGFRKTTNSTTAWHQSTRLTGATQMSFDSTAAETASTNSTFDFMEGWFNSASSIPTNYCWMFRRAPNFFDVVAYTGDWAAGSSVIKHNLGVKPELIIAKPRDAVYAWRVVCNFTPTSLQYGTAFTDAGISPALSYSSSTWVASEPTETEFTINTDTGIGYGLNYIAYLFATLAGVSKVGSYTGNGSSQTINCGFTSGARFILIKRTDSTGDWYVWDTARGIVTGNDPHLSLNTTAAEVTSDDSIDPASSGFIVNQVAATNINVTSASYIFYAIA